MKANKATPEQFEVVVRLLHSAIGECKAMTLDDITARAGLPNRRMAEALMEEYLPRFPYPLVASGAGYFIPTSAEQLNNYLRSLRSRAVKMFKRSKVVVNKAIAHGWKREGRWFAKPPQQLDLFSNNNPASRTNTCGAGKQAA